MALVTTTEMFKKAYDGGYAIGAFNVNNMEIVQAITEACKEEKAPVILQVSKGARAYANHTYLVKLVEAAGAALETIQNIFLVGGLQSIVQTANNIVAAGSLTAGQDHTNHLTLCGGGILTLLEGDLILAVGVGEQSLDLLLIRNGLGSVAVFHTNLGNAVSEHAGQLGLILVSCQLQRGNFHWNNTP